MGIIAAVDRSENAQVVVKEAYELATAFNETLKVVHVLSRDEFINLERTSVKDSGETIDMSRVREMAATIAKEAAEERTTEFESVGLIGDAANRLLKYVDEEDVRYIVIGGRRRSPVGKAIFGSVGQSIILNAEEPVVVVPYS